MRDAGVGRRSVNSQNPQLRTAPQLVPAIHLATYLTELEPIPADATGSSANEARSDTLSLNSPGDEDSSTDQADGLSLAGAVLQGPYTPTQQSPRRRMILFGRITTLASTDLFVTLDSDTPTDQVHFSCRYLSGDPTPRSNIAEESIPND
jgi:hypothetical protein